ncbi:MAG: hypothetical protein LC117_05070 [Bacteroidia bacterium]|nr:hypothetical protein [Bacteroidia bacterium]MCZ2277282.1 hypothetical protein [Bacteroidia bacterium]
MAILASIRMFYLRTAALIVLLLGVSPASSQSSDTLTQSNHSRLHELKKEAEENYEAFRNGAAFEALVRYAALKHKLTADSAAAELASISMEYADSLASQQNKVLELNQSIRSFKDQNEMLDTEKTRLFRNAAIYFIVITGIGLLVLNLIKKRKKQETEVAAKTLQSVEFIENYNIKAAGFHEAVKDVRFSFNSLSGISSQITDQLDKFKSICVTLDLFKPQWADASDRSVHLSASANHAVESIDHFQSFFSEAETTMQTSNLNLLLDDIIPLSLLWVKSEWKDFNCKVTKDLEKILPDFEFKPAALRIAFFHLLSNSFQSIAEKCQDGQKGFKPHLKVTSRKLPRFLQVRISDNGNGFNQKQATHAFDEYFTIREKPFNTGLGLAEAYRILNKEHKAEVIIESDVNDRTDFVIKFPFNR